MEKIVGLIDEDNAEEICFIHIYSNYIFYEGIIAGIKEYENSRNTRFSIEYRHSPVVLDNNILNRIDIYERDTYKHFKNKFNDFNNLDTDYYDTNLLYYYFFCNVYFCAIEKFKVNFPIEAMANISQEYVLDKYVLGNVGKLRKYPEVCEQVEKDVYNLYATFSNMCVGVHTGEVFEFNSQGLIDEFNRRIKMFIK